MEVLGPIHKMDIDFDSTCSSPAYYISAPTSPSKISQFYRDFDDFLASSSSVPEGEHDSFEAEFAFDVSGDFGNPCVSADELFDGGVIKPKQLPGAAFQSGPPLPAASTAARSTMSRGKDFLVGALSPRHKRDSNSSRDRENSKDRSPEHSRGRERTPGISSSSRRASRSLSPMRVSQFPWEEEHHHRHQYQQQYKEQSSAFTKPNASSSTNPSLSNCASKGFRKWRFKDLFLFRSASEGRAADKDPLRKHTAAFRRYEEEVKCSSFKNVEGPGPGSVSRRRGKVSAHELHYTVNRAVSEDLKKKTFLPYKQGILGMLAFNPAVHAVANGFGFSKK